MKPDSSGKDTAFSVMAMDILGNVLSRADNPADMGTYLTEEIRDLTGARCVLLVQCPGNGAEAVHRVVSVNPPRRREWAESKSAHRLYRIAHAVTSAQLWREGEPAEAAEILRQERFELSMVFPLNAGEFRVGALLVLGLPDETHISSGLGLLGDLSAIVALVLRNAILYDQSQKSTAALRESEEIYRKLTLFQRTILDNAAYGIISTTPDGIVTSYNPAVERLLGYTAVEMVGKQTPACWHDPEEVTRHALRLSGELGETITPGFEVFTARARRNLPEENEWTFISKDGRHIPVNMSVTALRDEEGHITGFVGMGYDLTERKRAEDALRNSENRYRLLVESSPMCIHEVDMDGRISSMNKAGLVMMGVEDECQVQGFLYLDAVCDADRGRIGELLGKAYAGEASNFEFMASGPGGLFFKSCFVPIKSSNGSVEKLMGITEDITERVQTRTYRDMGWDLLRVLNEPGNLQDSIQRVIAILKTGTGFEAVGIRLRDGDDYPYFAQQGFSKDFLRMENTLIARDSAGGICRNEDGNICLECTCGQVISDKTDPANPYVTQGGSCWTNDNATTPFIDTRLHPRDRCLHDGFQSVALVPIRTKERIVGLLQLNDSRKGLLTLYKVELLEGIASHISSALMRKQAEEALCRLNEELEQRVRERTRELERRNHELEQLNKVFVGRELKMVELKKRIGELEEKQPG